MLFSWFDTADVNQFAARVSVDYGRLRRHPALQNEPAKRLARIRKLAAEVRDFHRSKNLNFYKKARLLKGIGTGLREQAVPETEIAEFVNSVLFADLRSGS